MKAVIIGSNGQLGMDLMAAFAADQPVGLTHADIAIEQADSVASVLARLKPDVVINTAAYHKVDDCEKNPARSFEINALGAMHLAKTCNELGAVLGHVSTDYVFDGKKQAPYIESDLPHPLNVYAVSKVAGEEFVQAFAEKHFVIRSCGLYG